MRLKRFTLLSIVSIFIFTAPHCRMYPRQRPTVDPNRNTARDTIPDTNRDTPSNTDGVNPDTVPLRPNTIDEDRNNNRNNNTAVRDMEKKVANEVEKGCQELKMQLY